MNGSSPPTACRIAPLAAVLLGSSPAVFPAQVPVQAQAQTDAALAPIRAGHGRVIVPDVALPDPNARKPVSLDAVLAYADRHAPQLAVARERLSLGDAAVVASRPLLPDNPILSVGVGPGLNPGGRHVDASLQLSQRVELAGERGLRLQAAGRTQQRLHAELQEARWEVHREVHAAFHRALVERERRGAAERLLRFQERLLDITRRRLQAGDVSPLAVRLAEGELSQARVSRIAAQQTYLHTQLALGGVAGWPSAHPPEPAGELDVPRDPPDHAALSEVAWAHQPRLQTLHSAQVEAAAWARAADRDAFPEPSLGLQITREGFPAGPPETQVLGVLSLPLPLFQRNQGERAATRARERIAGAERAAFGAQLDYRIEQDRTAVLTAAERVRTYGSEILPTFEENLRLIQRAFELGEIDILQVSVARERFLRIQTDALDAYVDYFQAVADLEASIGTDLWPQERNDHAPEKEQRP